jgi:succinate dehydrogenase / fumarate reductase cytochrome b subunit
MAVQDTRPYYLNLLKIRLPIPAIVSILHRVSGVFLFLAIPVFVYLLDLSLQGEQGFYQVVDLLSQPLVKLALLLLIGSLVHHLFAGIRFLLIDFDIGLSKQQSIKTAWLVIVVEVVTLLFILLKVYL